MGFLLLQTSSNHPLLEASLRYSKVDEASLRCGKVHEASLRYDMRLRLGMKLRLGAVFGFNSSVSIQQLGHDTTRLYAMQACNVHARISCILFLYGKLRLLICTADEELSTTLHVNSMQIPRILGSVTKIRRVSHSHVRQHPAQAFFWRTCATILTLISSFLVAPS